MPLTYQITDDGLLTITNFWTKETIVTASVDLQGGEISYIDVTNAGPMYGVTINTINPNNIVTLLISNGTVISESRGYTVLQENVVNLDEDTIDVYKRQELTVVSKDNIIMLFMADHELYSMDDAVAAFTEVCGNPDNTYQPK